MEKNVTLEYTSIPRSSDYNLCVGLSPRAPWAFIFLFSFLFLPFAIIDKQRISSHLPLGILLGACLGGRQYLVCHVATLPLLSSFPSPLFSSRVTSLTHTRTRAYRTCLRTAVCPRGRPSVRSHRRAAGESKRGGFGSSAPRENVSAPRA